jgi:hypothetical protein
VKYRAFRLLHDSTIIATASTQHACSTHAATLTTRRMRRVRRPPRGPAFRTSLPHKKTSSPVDTCGRERRPARRVRSRLACGGTAWQCRRRRACAAPARGRRRRGDALYALVPVLVVSGHAAPTWRRCGAAAGAQLARRRSCAEHVWRWACVEVRLERHGNHVRRANTLRQRARMRRREHTHCGGSAAAAAVASACTAPGASPAGCVAGVTLLPS